MSSINPIIDRIVTWLQCDNVQPFSERGLTNYRNYHGNCPSPSNVQFILDEVYGVIFEALEGWSDGRYGAVWISDPLLAIITYAKGDVTVTVCHSIASYKAEIKRAHEFYRDGSSGDRDFHSFIEYSPIANEAINEISGVEQEFWQKIRLYLTSSMVFIGDSVEEALNFAERFFAKPSQEDWGLYLAIPKEAGYLFTKRALPNLRQILQSKGLLTQDSNESAS